MSRLRNITASLSRPTTSSRRLALTRQGALTLARRLAHDRALSPALRLLMVIVGSGFIGVGVNLFLAADLGLPPYDVLLSAITNGLGISHGQAGWALAAAFYLVAALVGERPNRWALLYVLANGVAIDAIGPLLSNPTSMGGRWLFVLIGTVSIASGVAVVAHTTSTGGAFELWTRAAQNRGYNPTRFRTGLELVIVGLGALLGGSFGYGTAVFALAIGVSLAVVSQGLADHRAGRFARIEASANTHPSRVQLPSQRSTDPDWQQDLRLLETS